jgi:hypothetical protein
VEKNVVADESALEELERLDVYSTPATLIGDELVVGFNRKKLEETIDI